MSHILLLAHEGSCSYSLRIVGTLLKPIYIYYFTIYVPSVWCHLFPWLNPAAALLDQERLCFLAPWIINLRRPYEIWRSVVHFNYIIAYSMTHSISRRRFYLGFDTLSKYAHPGFGPELIRVLSEGRSGSPHSFICSASLRKIAASAKTTSATR